MNRRTFLLASAASLPVLAQNRVRAGVIGSGGRGRLLTANFKEIGAEVNAVCDVYEPNLQAGLKLASTGAKPYDNYKRLLEDKSIDAVIIATPDHWHARMVIDAVQAGKDVYIEKPLAHTIAEGEMVVKAVRATNRIVQVGTQRRSSPLFQDAKAVINGGTLGDIRLVNSWWINNQRDFPARPLAGKLDWEQWLGTAPKRAVDPTRFFNWYYFWDYSGGMMVGQAAHIVDMIQWFMDSRRPKAVTCTAGQPNVPTAEVPETTTMAIEYPENYLAVFTVGYKGMRYNTFNDQMSQFHGNKARFDVGREHWLVYPESNAVEMKPSQERKEIGSFEAATRQHIRNFLECVRSRKEPNAPVEAGEAANRTLCMAMDSLRTGRRVASS